MVQLGISPLVHINASRGIWIGTVFPASDTGKVPRGIEALIGAVDPMDALDGFLV